MANALKSKSSSASSSSSSSRSLPHPAGNPLRSLPHPAGNPLGNLGNPPENLRLVFFLAMLDKLRASDWYSEAGIVPLIPRRNQLSELAAAYYQPLRCIIRSTFNGAGAGAGMVQHVYMHLGCGGLFEINPNSNAFRDCNGYRFEELLRELLQQRQLVEETSGVVIAREINITREVKAIYDDLRDNYYKIGCLSVIPAPLADNPPNLHRRARSAELGRGRSAELGRGRNAELGQGRSAKRGRSRSAERRQARSAEHRQARSADNQPNPEKPLSWKTVANEIVGRAHHSLMFMFGNHVDFILMEKLVDTFLKVSEVVEQDHSSCLNSVLGSIQRHFQM